MKMMKENRSTKPKWSFFSGESSNNDSQIHKNDDKWSFQKSKHKQELHNTTVTQFQSSPPAGAPARTEQKFFGFVGKYV